MNAYAANGRLTVWVSLFFAMMLQIMPLPDVVDQWRPDWLLMAIMYWAMALPYRYSIITAWVLGVILDIFLGAHLGIRAMAFSLVTYIVVLHFQRLRHFPRWQQSLLIGCFIALYHLVVYWLQFVVVGGTEFDWHLMQPVLSSLFIWWWVFWVLRNIRRNYKVR